MCHCAILGEEQQHGSLCRAKMHWISLLTWGGNDKKPSRLDHLSTPHLDCDMTPPPTSSSCVATAAGATPKHRDGTGDLDKTLDNRHHHPVEEEGEEAAPVLGQYRTTAKDEKGCSDSLSPRPTTVNTILSPQLAASSPPSEDDDDLASVIPMRRVVSSDAGFFLSSAVSPDCHHVTVEPCPAASDAARTPEVCHGGLCRALQLGTRVNFLPVRKAFSSCNVDGETSSLMIPEDEAFEPSSCGQLHQTTSDAIRACSSGGDPMDSSPAFPCDDDAGSKDAASFDVDETTRASSCFWSTSAPPAPRRRIVSDTVVDNRTRWRKKEQPLVPVSELRAFSVELASLLHRGFSSTVWLCNSPQIHHHDDDAGADNTSSETMSIPGSPTRSTDFCLDEETPSYRQPFWSSIDKTENGDDDTVVPHLMQDDPEQADPNTGDTAVVMKVVHKAKCSEEELEQLTREAEFLSSVSHPHVIPLLSVVYSETEQWMFFEHAPRGDLQSATMYKTVPEAACRWIIFQLLLALREIHTLHRLVHCDVKPRNVLLFDDAAAYGKYRRTPPTTMDDNRSTLTNNNTDEAGWRSIKLKLTDFGLAQHVPEGCSEIPFEGLRGTHGYLAPELLLRKSYNEKIDMWALGVIAFSLIAGYEPFYPVSSCMKDDLEFDGRYWGNISGDAKHFVRALLERNPTKRPSAAEALQYDWINLEFQAPF